MDTLALLSLIANVLYPGIAFTAGLFRWNRIDGSYKPLLLILGSAFLAELFRLIQGLNYSYKLGLPIGFSPIGYNLYVLAISILYLLLFYNHGIFRRKKWLFNLLIFVFVGFWAIDHFIIPGNSIFGFTKYFRVFYSFTICLLAIQWINMLLVSARKSLLKNSSFLICIAILFFFLPYVLTECVTFFIKDYSFDYLNAVFRFRKFSLPVIYFIYTLAVLWMPPKKPFIQLS